MEKANKKIKPQCAEDLLNLRQEDMSKEEWYSEIMHHWKCSRRTVFTWLHKYGIETRQYGNTPSIAEQWKQRYLIMKEIYLLDVEVTKLLSKELELFKKLEHELH